VTDALERILYCLRLNLPHPVIIAILDDDTTIEDAYKVWTNPDYGLDPDHFHDTIRTITGYEVVTCQSCLGVTWEDDAYNTDNNADTVCGECIHQYERCYQCEEYTYNGDVTWVNGRAYCEPCCENHCFYCVDCEEWDTSEHDHDEGGCDCEAPHLRFLFPANGAGTVTNDERLDVTLPAGTIDEVGLRLIRNRLLDEGHPWTAVEKSLNAVGDQWQAKRGNYTRRLSRELYANHQIKVADGVLSEIGNLARQHSSDTATWSVGFTRDLNLSANDFAHDESCWWGSYYESRCALKQWGGIGLRTFDPYYDSVTGRVWVQPLNDEMQPTHDAVNAHAYVVYNAYGDITGYQAARLIAHLTSRTYRKIDLSSSPQYINNNTGFLVADEATCAETTGLSFTADAHNVHDARNIDQEVAA
jgi:hypothetical protein